MAAGALPRGEAPIGEVGFGTSPIKQEYNPILTLCRSVPYMHTGGRGPARISFFSTGSLEAFVRESIFVYYGTTPEGSHGTQERYARRMGVQRYSKGD